MPPTAPGEARRGDLPGAPKQFRLRRPGDEAKDGPPGREALTPKTKERGTTQALRLGAARDPSTAEFTTHIHRDQDRINIRERIDVEYRFLTMKGQMAGPFRGKLVDISLGGAQIEGPIGDLAREDLLSEKVIVRIEAALPYVERPFVMDCRATWTKPSEGENLFLGLKYVDLGKVNLNLIRAFLIGLQSPTRKKPRRGR